MHQMQNGSRNEFASSFGTRRFFQRKSDKEDVARLIVDEVRRIVANICFVWILPPLEVDPVRKDGVGVEVKIDGVVVIGLEETGTSLRIEVRVRQEDSYRYDRHSCILL